MKGAAIMATGGAGGVEFRGRAYRFDQAHGTWWPGDLVIEAEGKRCWMSLVGIPFPGATEPAQLPGRVWEPDDDELALYADTFAEGGLEIKGRRYNISGCRVECLRYDPERDVLTLSFHLDVELDETGRQDEAVGVVYCELW
jgi:hypothetical protein